VFFIIFRTAVRIQGRTHRRAFNDEEGGNFLVEMDAQKVDTSGDIHPRSITDESATPSRGERSQATQHRTANQSTKLTARG